MIDKNDVKMPRQELIRSTDNIQMIEELLRLVNAEESTQELRLKNDYYSKFNWFGGSVSGAKKSYFSYQEEAVYDFIFNLNKSGILSDQVGMGKTIEAGMIISELASRHELRSLLIIVPNEIMAKKWESELKEKFGITKNVTSMGTYPEAYKIDSMDKFYRCIFECVWREKFFRLHEGLNVTEREAQESDSPFLQMDPPQNEDNFSLEEYIAAKIKKDIALAVRMVNDRFKDEPVNGKNYEVVFDGKRFYIKGTEFSSSYVYDSTGLIAEYLKTTRSSGRRRTTASHTIDVLKRKYLSLLMTELQSLFYLLGHLFSTVPDEIARTASKMINNYPILIIPIAFSDYDKTNGQVILHDFLNHVMMNSVNDFRHQYVGYQNSEDAQTDDEKGQDPVRIYEDYTVVDFFIDVGYQTMIVDEVHDYIDVCYKMGRAAFHNDKKKQAQYSSDNYNRYELFDDYYFINKKSLYKKLKFLADKATRKIFLTATPIKSDMVDFYLLTLLASNKDSEIYRSISEKLNANTGSEFSSNEEVEQWVGDAYDAFIRNLDKERTPKYYKENFSFFTKEKERDASTVVTGSQLTMRYEYPYMINDYINTHLNDLARVSDYLRSLASYMTVEEIVMELIIAYRSVIKDTSASKAGSGSFVKSTKQVLEAITDILDDTSDYSEIKKKKTFIVFHTLLNNTVKLRFEEDFTTPQGEYVKQIRDLLQLPDGPRRWHKTYRKYGIRHTRHQTYNLTDCELLDKLNKSKGDRFKNLPIWPRRDGEIFFLFRDDVFFDSYVQVQRQLPPSDPRKKTITIEELPNIDKMAKTEEEKQAAFENALAIFNYINNSMSGGDPHTHRPFSHPYESVSITDENMVEYKLALVNRMMIGNDRNIKQLKGKVLLFAEKDRDKILEWFMYQHCSPLCDNKPLDEAKARHYQEKLAEYGTQSLSINGGWSVSDQASALNSEGNVLIIIDPTRYEKGVDLQKANTMINFDIAYCPLKMEQRIGRIDRIRASSKKEDQQIEIISFVPLNDMSGFVINFFANELKMFTQWMGETTGIVSVPSDEKGVGEAVSFEDKVKNLEIYYNFIYRLCTSQGKTAVSDDEIKKMIEGYEEVDGDKKTKIDGFANFFKLKGGKGEETIDPFKFDADFRFIRELRDPFNNAFINSMSPQRQGYSVEGSETKVMRFNTYNGIFTNCSTLTCNDKDCSACKNEYCKKKGPDSVFMNSASAFVEALLLFYNKGITYAKQIVKECDKRQNGGLIRSANEEVKNNSVRAIYDRRIKQFEAELQETRKLLESLGMTKRSDKAPFTVRIDRFNEIFNRAKKLYWDEVVNEHIQLIISHFYVQCDSVLSSAELFEKFIKTLSVADFMNNMEGAE